MSKIINIINKGEMIKGKNVPTLTLTILYTNT